MKDAPKRILKLGRIRFKVWENDFSGGKSIMISPMKVYTVDKEVKTSNYYGISDLKNMETLIQRILAEGIIETCVDDTIKEPLQELEEGTVKDEVNDEQRELPLGDVSIRDKRTNKTSVDKIVAEITDVKIEEIDEAGEIVKKEKIPF